MNGSKRIFTAADLDVLARHGQTSEDVLRQMERLGQANRAQKLLSPARISQGILRLSPDERESLRDRFRLVMAEGRSRICRFVPASGAASRMFGFLLTWLNNPVPQPEVEHFFTNLDRFPFHHLLVAAGLDPSDRRSILAHMFNCLRYNELPKAVLPFHRQGNSLRTPLHEHLDQLAALCSLAPAKSGFLHLTISEEHEPVFARTLAEIKSPVPCEFSVQEKRTNTVALTDSGELLRDSRGTIVFRPGGHGALIHNLGRIQADLIFIQNIDNVPHPQIPCPSLADREVMAGLLLEVESLRSRLFRHFKKAALLSQELSREMREAAHRWPGLFPSSGLEDLLARRDAMLAHFDRPLRICGMVPNQGETGGGPFWVSDADDHARLQIIEAAQINRDDRQQVELFAQATHFNPVDMVCSLNNYLGRRHDLNRFIDTQSNFASEKNHEGRQIRVLEHPGLWNGAMASWLTLFVEMDPRSFCPVKTVNDLLRPAHQPVLAEAFPGHLP